MNPQIQEKDIEDRDSTTLKWAFNANYNYLSNDHLGVQWGQSAPQAKDAYKYFTDISWQQRHEAVELNQPEYFTHFHNVQKAADKLITHRMEGGIHTEYLKSRINMKEVLIRVMTKSLKRFKQKEEELVGAIQKLEASAEKWQTVRGLAQLFAPIAAFIGSRQLASTQRKLAALQSQYRPMESILQEVRTAVEADREIIAQHDSSLSNKASSKIIYDIATIPQEYAAHN